MLSWRQQFFLQKVQEDMQFAVQAAMVVKPVQAFPILPQHKSIPKVTFRSPCPMCKI